MLYRINSNGFYFCGQVSEFAYHFLFTSFFIGAVRVPLKSYTYITHMYIFPLFDIMGKLLYISGYILPLLVSLGSTVTQNIFFLLFFLRSISGDFFPVDFTHFLFMSRCLILMLMGLPEFFLIIQSDRPVHNFMKHFLMGFRRIFFVDKYCGMIVTTHFIFSRLGQ